MIASLAPCRIQRIDAPVRGLFCLTIWNADGEQVLVISLAGLIGYGLVAQRPRGAPASAQILKLRKHLESRWIDAITDDGNAICLRLRNEDSEPRLSICAQLTAHEGSRRLLLVETSPDKQVELLEIRLPSEGARFFDRNEALTLEQRGARIVEAIAAGTRDALRAALRAAVQRQQKKLDKRLVAIGKDLQRDKTLDESIALRLRADLLMAHIHAWRPGTLQLEVVDYTTEPPQDVTIVVAKGSAPQKEAATLYKRAKRLSETQRHAKRREAETLAEQQDLRHAEQLIAGAQTYEELAALAKTLRRKGMSGLGELDEARVAPPRASKTKKSTEAGAFRVFYATDGRPIHVGRGAADNDKLTFKESNSHDLWLHARGVPGAHVIVPLRKKEQCPSELLLDAATLAAHFSDARAEARVEVIYAPRQRVKKPKGAAPGAVLVEQEKVILVRIEKPRLERLLVAMMRA